MISPAERILEALEPDSQGLCDDCLVNAAQVSPRQQVNSICNRLRAKNLIAREKMTCWSCGGSKLVNRIGISSASVSNEIRLTRTPKKSPHPNSGTQFVAHAEQLDSTRRAILKMLDHLEEAKAKGQGFSERVSKLRDTGVLPGNIACMMQTLNSLRNLCVYDSYLLATDEMHLSELAWDVVNAWWNKRS